MDSKTLNIYWYYKENQKWYNLLKSKDHQQKLFTVGSDEQCPSSVCIYQIPVPAWTQGVYFTESVISLNVDAITVLILQTSHTALREITIRQSEWSQGVSNSIPRQSIKETCIDWLFRSIHWNKESYKEIGHHKKYQFSHYPVNK